MFNVMTHNTIELANPLHQIKFKFFENCKFSKNVNSLPDNITALRLNNFVSCRGATHILHQCFIASIRIASGINFEIWSGLIQHEKSILHRLHTVTFPFFFLNCWSFFLWIWVVKITIKLAIWSWWMFFLYLHKFDFLNYLKDLTENLNIKSWPVRVVNEMYLVVHKTSLQYCMMQSAFLNHTI